MDFCSIINRAQRLTFQSNLAPLFWIYERYGVLVLDFFFFLSFIHWWQKLSATFDLVKCCAKYMATVCKCIFRLKEISPFSPFLAQRLTLWSNVAPLVYVCPYMCVRLRISSKSLRGTYVIVFVAPIAYNCTMYGGQLGL